MKKEEIIKAWETIRTENITIPDDVLDFMKDSAIKSLSDDTIKEYPIDTSIMVSRGYDPATGIEFIYHEVKRAIDNKITVDQCSIPIHPNSEVYINGLQLNSTDTIKFGNLPNDMDCDGINIEPITLEVEIKVSIEAFTIDNDENE